MKTENSLISHDGNISKIVNGHTFIIIMVYYLRVSEWNSGSWLKRCFIVATIIVPSITEYCILLNCPNYASTPFIVCMMTKAQALSIMGSVLGSLFGKSVDHIVDHVNRDTYCVRVAI